jgi:L-lysine exporter family protein LysE/ArgO
LAQAAAFTLLNPHVYLDTVLLVGSIGAQQPEPLQGWFSRPRAWQVLDALIGLSMWVLSALLVQHTLENL